MFEVYTRSLAINSQDRPHPPLRSEHSYSFRCLMAKKCLRKRRLHRDQPPHGVRLVRGDYAPAFPQVAILDLDPGTKPDHFVVLPHGPSNLRKCSWVCSPRGMPTSSMHGVCSRRVNPLPFDLQSAFARGIRPELRSK